jgi:hypothetical protein
LKRILDVIDRIAPIFVKKYQGDVTEPGERLRTWPYKVVNGEFELIQRFSDSTHSMILLFWIPALRQTGQSAVARLTIAAPVSVLRHLGRKPQLSTAKVRAERPSKDSLKPRLPTTAPIVECVSRNALKVTICQQQSAGPTIDAKCEINEHSLIAAIAPRGRSLTIQFSDFNGTKKYVHVFSCV